jgi:predicted aspartyl protease
VIRIDTVRVGDRVLHDVIAGVMPNGAEPLLGFPVLNQAGRFTIDTKNSQLIFD